MEVSYLNDTTVHQHRICPCTQISTNIIRKLG